MAERGACEGPDFFQIDLSFYKSVQLTDRFDLQLRLEIFNIFNNNNYLGVDLGYNATVTTLDGPLDQATTIVDSQPSPTFGQAFAARDPRQVQLGAKISF